MHQVKHAANSCKLQTTYTLRYIDVYHIKKSSLMIQKCKRKFILINDTCWCVVFSFYLKIQIFQYHETICNCSRHVMVKKIICGKYFDIYHLWHFPRAFKIKNKLHLKYFVLFWKALYQNLRWSIIIFSLISTVIKEIANSNKRKLSSLNIIKWAY